MNLFSIAGGRGRNVFFSILLVTALAAISGACNRNLDATINTVSNAVRDSSGGIRKVLDSTACSCTLFDRAFVRAGLDSTFLRYIVLAPTDSAMMAAGLTSAVIDALTTDSLGKLVGYHLILSGDSSILYNDTLTAQLATLERDPMPQPSGTGALLAPYYYQQYVYVWNRGSLYVNGVAAGTGQPPLKASNGWIYAINRVLHGPSQSLWSILQTRPELTMYVAAIRLVDSIARYNYAYGQVSDSAVFSSVTLSFPNVSSAPSVPNLSTVLAPTNTAFANAGFHTVDDLRNFALRTLPGGGQFDALDSVLKLHYCYKPGNPVLTYQDMLYSPVVDNGVYNSNSWYVMQYANNPSATPFYPQFTNINGTVEVQWDPTLPAAPLPASAPLMATNGAIYEIDQLFYPHN